MSCRRVAVWAFMLWTMAGPSVRAQNPFPQDLIPTRTSLARLGLERQWTAVIPLHETERLLRISRSADLFFAQTNNGGLHTYDAETGKLLWSANMGGYTPFAWPVSANSYGVFGTVGDALIAFDRRTGRVIWKAPLGTIPSSGTVADEDRVMVGTSEGRLNAYSLREKGPKGEMRIRSKPVEDWGWQTSGPVTSLPLPAMHMVAFGSSDGRVYVVMNNERTTLYRVRTGGPIGDGLGAYGTRMLLIPSADNNLYAVDLLTAENLWVFPSGAPIEQAPMVAGEDILSINRAGYLTSLDPATGNPRWNTATADAKLLSLSPTKIYLRSSANDLVEIDRSTGQVLADPSATRLRAGLNLREYGLSMLNRFDDRVYFGTDSGMVVCLRELGATQPRPLRDAKALPFGYIPPEGIKKTPPAVPAAEPGDQPKEGEKDAEPKPDAAAPTPDASEKPAAEKKPAAQKPAAAPKAAEPK